MRKKIVLFIATFLVAIPISAYVYLSITAGRFLVLSEFTRFSRVILLAAFLHSDENGGQQALQLFKEALTSSVQNGVIEIDGQQYSYPLPKYSVRQPGHSDYYLAFVTDEEWQEYFQVELPKAGWNFHDQIGATHFYFVGDAKLAITEHRHLTSEISTIGAAVMHR